jgi:hypothetical protein
MPVMCDAIVRCGKFRKKSLFIIIMSICERERERVRVRVGREREREREREPESCPTNAHCCIKRANTNAANPKKNTKESQSTHHENTGKLLRECVLYMQLLHTLYFTRITAILLTYHCLTSQRTCSVHAAPAHALLGFTRIV